MRTIVRRTDKMPHASKESQVSHCSFNTPMYPCCYQHPPYSLFSDDNGFINADFTD